MPAWLPLRLLPLSVLFAPAFTAAILLGGGLSAIHAGEIGFEKTVLDNLFRSEGVAVAELNQDGKNDIVVGDLWYAAPDWKPHEIRPPRKPERTGYTEAFAVYADDFNRDGWVDVLVIPFHGKDARWYENPKGNALASAGHWTERVAFKGTGNETRIRPDLFADGKPVFLMGVEGAIAWVEVPEDATGPWTVHAISDGKTDAAHQFAHGLGIGDVNGDGRNDVLHKGGWWEQPKEGRMAKAAWKYHPGKISDDCADMYVADLDGDGRGEVLSTSAHNYGFWWHRPEGDAASPTFKTETLDKTIFETHSANYVDLDGDGRRELVTGQRFGAHGFKDERAPSELVWYDLSPQKDGPPKATLHVVDDQSGVGAQFVTTDVDGDGRQDIVVSNRKGVFLFRQKKEAK